MAALIDSVIELASLDYDLKKKYAFREIHIVREYDSQLPYVPCLEKDIKQVILNLLRNAAQALAERAPQASPPTITLRTRREGEMALIEVEDNGPGMEPDLQRHIFEPFFTTREVGEGSGLGLSVAYFIVHDRHQGRLVVDSVPGRGSRIAIHLPLESRLQQRRVTQ
jgi:signal transduction histidine kinase